MSILARSTRDLRPVVSQFCVHAVGEKTYKTGTSNNEMTREALHPKATPSADETLGACYSARDKERSAAKAELSQNCCHWHRGTADVSVC